MVKEVRAQQVLYEVCSLESQIMYDDSTYSIANGCHHITSDSNCCILDTVCPNQSVCFFLDPICWNTFILNNAPDNCIYYDFNGFTITVTTNPSCNTNPQICVQYANPGTYMVDIYVYNTYWNDTLQHNNGCVTVLPPINNKDHAHISNDI